MDYKGSANEKGMGSLNVAASVSDQWGFTARQVSSTQV